jgi:hypothetical protein
MSLLEDFPVPATRCSFCGANLVGIAHYSCSLAPGLYCEGCWKLQPCMLTHPLHCGTLLGVVE